MNMRINERDRKTVNLERGAGHASAPADGGRQSLRERNKRDKLRRIKAAARALFVAKGFDEATTREIAQCADVGMGTLFLYADNKRDLLFLVVNDDLEALVDEATRRFRAGGGVLDNLMGVFKLHYRFFGREPALSRYALREMTFYGTGQQAMRFRQTRERMMALLVTMVADGQKHAGIDPNVDPGLFSWTAFCIYQVELRRWLDTDAPALRSGITRLEKAIGLLLTGASPARSPGRSWVRGRRARGAKMRG